LRRPTTWRRYGFSETISREGKIRQRKGSLRLGRIYADIPAGK